MNWSSLFSQVARPRRRRKGAAAKHARVSSGLQVESLEDRCVMAADPVAVLSTTPVEGLLGEQVTFNVSFDNRGPDVGYGPYVDLFIDTTGADGGVPGQGGYDGFTVAPDGAGFQASYLGAPLASVTPIVLTGSTFTHPLTGQTVDVPEFGTRFQAGDMVLVLQMPFGSFSADQPPAPIQVTMGTSALANVDQDLAVSAIAGFRYGNDPLDDPDADPPLRQSDASASKIDVGLDVWRVYKVYEGPENETATGPNHAQRYRLEVDVAAGQTITNLVLRDILSASMQYTGQNLSGTLNGNAVAIDPANLTEPDFAAAGGTVSYTYASVTGAAGIDATFEFEFFVAQVNGVTGDVDDGALGSIVLPDAASSVRHTNHSYTTASWDPTDPDDAPLALSADSRDPTNIHRGEQRHTLEEQSIATQKYVEAGALVGGVWTPLAPGERIVPGVTLLRYVVDFQASDYFALDQVRLQDLLSDGQRLWLGAGAAPTLSVSNVYAPGATGAVDGRVDAGAAAFGSDMIDYVQGYTERGTLDSDPAFDPATEAYFRSYSVAGDLTQGTTGLTFHISDELERRFAASDGRLVGGNIDQGGSQPHVNEGASAGYPASDDYGAVAGGVRGQIVFYAQVKNEFSDNFPSGDRSVDQLDVLVNDVDVYARKLDPTNLATPMLVGGSPVFATDDTRTSIALPSGQLTKTLYAVNGVVAGSGLVAVQPGDLVTYRLTYTLPLSSFENLTITDFMPLPVLPVPLAMTFSGTPYQVNTIASGPNNTYFAVNPAVDGAELLSVTTDADANSVTLNFGTFEDIPGGHRASTIDLLLTVRVADADFTQDLFLTNQFRSRQGSTNAGDQILDAVVQFVVVAPMVDVYKGIVGFWGDGGVPEGYTLGGAQFDPPLTAPSNSWYVGNNIYNAAQAGAIGASNLTGADAGDWVRHGIVLQNTGRGDAYDVSFVDVLPAEYQTPIASDEFASVTNLSVRRGDGEEMFGVQVDEFVRVATVAALGGTFDQGVAGDPLDDGFTGVSSTLDGLSLVLGDRVLVKNQGAAAQNGVYRVSAASGSTVALTRDSSFAASAATEHRVAVLGGLTAANANHYFTTAADDGGGAWTAGADQPVAGDPVFDYYFTYDAATRQFGLNLTDAYTADNTSDATADIHPGGLSRGASGGSSQSPVTNGSNTIVVTYDLQLDTTAGGANNTDPPNPSEAIVNTAIVTRIAKSDGGVPGDNPSDPATVTVAAPTITKTLVVTEVDSAGNNAGDATGGQATIGEYVTYTVVVSVPEGVMPNAVVLDNLDAGLAFVDVTNVVVNSNALSGSNGLSAAGSGAANTAILNLPANRTVTNSGRTVAFNLGTLTNTNRDDGATETITITYRVVVLNVNAAAVDDGANQADNQAGQMRNNSARIQWTGNAATGPTASAANVTIVEPQVGTVKQVQNVTAGGGFGASIPADDEDVVQFRIQLAASGSTAYEVSLSDPLPAAELFSTPLSILDVAFTGNIRIGGAAATSATLRAQFQIIGNTLQTIPGADIDMDAGATISITLEGTYAGATGLAVPNTATAQWSSLDGDPGVRSTHNTESSVERTGVDGLQGSGALNDYRTQSTATIEGPPLVYKSIMATSEPSTGTAIFAPGVLSAEGAIGELVRYRLYVSIDEGTTNNFQVVDFLPPGMAFVNDGSARYSFITNGTGITSSAAGTVGALPGNQSTVTGGGSVLSTLASSSITGLFGDGNISPDAAGAGTGDAALYGAGSDVFFRFGALNNQDDDNDLEFVVIEFNALVLNDLGNQAGAGLVNNFGVLVDTDGDGTPGYVSTTQDLDVSGTRSPGDVTKSTGDVDNDVATGPATEAALSNNAVVTIVEPNLQVVKNVLTTSTTAGVTTVTYQITVRNTSTTADAFDVHLRDVLPASLDLQGTASNFTWSGAPGTVANNTDVGTDTVDVTLDRLLKNGQSFSFEYTTDVTPGAEYPGSVTIDNTIRVDYTSLPGATGTVGGWSGVPDVVGVPSANSTVPGAPGTSTGERTGEDGKGGLNDYVDSDTQSLGSLGDRVYFDVDGDGVQDAGEGGIVGVTVTLIFDADHNGTYGDPGDSTVTVVTGADGMYLFNGLPLYFSDPTTGVQSAAKYQVSVPTIVAGMNVTDAYDDGFLSATATVTPTLTGAGTGDGSNVQNRRDVDFGYRGTGRIGDRVYIDADADGVQDANGLEPNLPGVDVSLTWAGLDGAFGTADDIVLSTQSGNPVNPLAPNYLFDFLPTGDFRIDVSGEGGTGGVPSNTTLTDSVDDGAINPATSVLVNLPAAGASSLVVDFGYRGTAAIGDTVWYDADADGVQDAGATVEPGIAGAAVTLTFGGADGNLATTGDNVVFTTLTDADGKYLFSSLPVQGAGSPYRVTVAPPVNFPVQTYDADDGTGPFGSPDSSTLILGPTETNLLQDFGYRGNASLGDFVWEDMNGNGRQDGGEPGLDGVAVELLMAGADDTFGTGDDIVLLTTVTAGGGKYAFDNLGAANYQVRFGTLPGYVRTRKDSAAADDANDSDADPTTGRTGIYAVALSTVNNTVDSGLYRFQDIGDTVWYDVDGSGGATQGAGEPGVPNVKVDLDYAGLDGIFGGAFAADDVIGVASTLTDSTGKYLFADLAPGVYRVSVDASTLPNGVVQQTYDLDGTATGNNAVLALASGADRLDADFSYTAAGTIGDRVYNDADGDGVQDANGWEPSVSGVTVTLVWAGFDGDFGTTSDNVVRTTVSGSPANPFDPNYLFSRLAAGEYRVEVSSTGGTGGVPADMTLTDSLDDGSLSADPAPIVSLAIGQNRTDVDFGYQWPGVIGDTIFLDVDNDSLPDSGEGLGGVTVRLSADLDGDGLDENFTLTTDPEGIYNFTGLPLSRLDGGMIVYTVTVDPFGNTLPPGVRNSTDPDGGFDGTSKLTLTQADPVNNEQDFGYRGPKAIEGSVYIDLDQDGKRGDEPGIPGVLVTLTFTVDDDGPGGPQLEIVSTRTDANGYYAFSGLPAFEANGKLASYVVTQAEQPPFVDGKEQLRGVVLEGTDYRSPDQRDVLPPIQFNPDNLPETVVQNNFGEYLFTIPEPPQDAPITFPVETLTVPRLEVPVYLREEFGLQNPSDLERRFSRRDELMYASVEGAVFADADNDGVFDSDERGVPGVLVKLDGPSNLQAVTDEDGRYAFDELPVGTYSIFEIRPDGMLRGKLSVGSAGGAAADNAFTDVGLSAGEHGTDYNFGELPPARVAGKSFLDRNRNGVQDSGELGTPGVLVKVTGVDDRGAPVSVGAFTGWDGAFSVEDLRPGVYTVTQMPLPTFRSGPATVGVGGGTAGNGTISGIEIAPADASGGMVFPVQMIDTPQNAAVPLRWLWGAMESPMRAFGLARADAGNPERAASRAAEGQTSDARDASERSDLARNVESSAYEAAAMGAVGLAGMLVVSRPAASRRSRTWEESVDRLFSGVGEDN